ncbi:MAG: DNA-binding protein [bacterium]|nr:DNA-binding protein [bacterium]
MYLLFLDANVLFSAAWRKDAALTRLWTLPNFQLRTSSYAVQEAKFNLETTEQRARLQSLIQAIHLVNPARFDPLPDQVRLPEKDQPILQAAIASRSTYLLTGDIRHFSALFGCRIQTVYIMRPGEYLKVKTSEC